jgi:hypothetical protein
MINSIGRQPRGKILSELRDTSVDVNDNTENDHWKKGRLQDDDGSELHDMASQKNMRARATDRPELADERSKKVAIAKGPASRELERNSRWLRPVPGIARGHTMNEERKEVRSVQQCPKWKMSAGCKETDQRYQEWTREQRQNPLGSEGWFDEYWLCDSKRCNCYGWDQRCWSRSAED